KLVETLARAMHYAHQRGVVHRDLKPGNILLTPDGQPKITDFGLARQLECESSFTQPGAIMGTPSYMAPEQAMGRNDEVGPPADTYALGTILYELVTSRPPFRGARILETLEQVRKQEPVPPSRLQPGLPRDLETICLKCLQKEPLKRYDCALALADDLRRFLEGKPILARPVGYGERVWRWAKRNPGLASLSGVALSLLLTVVVGSIVAFFVIRAARDEAVQRLIERYVFEGVRSNEEGDM